LADQVNTSHHPRMLGAGGAFGIDMRQMRRARPLPVYLPSASFEVSG
jgi:hypothetical protein